MRFALLIGVAVSGLMLSSCASPGSNFIGDNLPEWAGGLPPDAPPRRGAPGYRDYIRKLSGEEGAGTAAASATAGPAAPSTGLSTTTASPNVPPAAQNQPGSPPRKAPGSIDQPIH
ncbi:MAG TPA: hypothetical protein VKX28_13370 [Xanthobacteraceae bacterium]|nr:hypothetical protein [Xanthobacteraceae bacterium]